MIDTIEKVVGVIKLTDPKLLRLPKETLLALVNYAERRFNQESSRPEGINSRTSLYVTAISLLVGILAYLANALPHVYSGAVALLCCLLVVAVCFVAVLVYQFWQVLKGQDYAHMPNPIDVAEQAYRLRDYVQTNYDQYFSKCGQIEEVESTLFRLYVAQNHAACTKQDFACNNSRAAALVVIGRYLVAMCVIEIVAFILLILTTRL